MDLIEHIPREEFINQVVIPFFYGNLYKDLVVIVYDLDGKVLFTNHRYANFYNFELEDIIGKTFIEFSQNINISPQMARKVDSIRLSVIRTQQEVKYVLFLDEATKVGAYTSLQFPIFYSDGTIIATAVRSDPYIWLSRTSLFAELQITNEIDTSIDYSKIILTTRQEEVLFLLIAGFSQEQIAIHLELSRGTISSCVANLCKKFGIYKQSTSILIALTAELKYGSIIPKSLIKEGVVML